MAVARMTKVIIVSHRTQASALLEALQREGICQILNAEQATVTRDFTELVAEAERPRDIEQMLVRLKESISFLSGFKSSKKGLATVLTPRAVVQEDIYNKVVSDKKILEVVEQVEQIRMTIEGLEKEKEHIIATLHHLEPWRKLESPVDHIGRLNRTTLLAVMTPTQNLEQLSQGIAELGAAIQLVDTTGGKAACVVVFLNENLADVQKLLHQADCEQVDFEGMTSTAAELIKQNMERIKQIENDLKGWRNRATLLAEDLLNIEILHDHYGNLLSRERTRGAAPVTEQTVLLEGWVKKADYGRLEKLVSRFDASSLSKIEPAEDEEVPVEIENPNTVRPFESVTRLYGMPEYLGVDPTVLLAPFFTLFFAMCLGDAGYGLIIILSMAFLIKKMRGDKKLLWMLTICAAATVVMGALTGGWFGDAIQNFVPPLQPIRRRLMWFDPLERPMIFFAASLILGYVQINFGIFIAFVHNLYQRKFVAAVCDQLTWLVMLNSIVCLFLSKTGILPDWSGRIFAWATAIPAVIILLFSQREGGLAGRLGMGLYQLFSTVFYIGDVLSYVRLMALGITSAGLAMAVNVVAKVVYDIPVVGIFVAIAVWIGGHLFTTALSALGAFVHTLRLQYVEFFSKFFVGSGRAFEPLCRKYKYVNVSETK